MDAVNNRVLIAIAALFLLAATAQGSQAQAQTTYVTSTGKTIDRDQSGFPVPALQCVGKPLPCTYATTAGGVQIQREFVRVIASTDVVVGGSKLRVLTFTDRKQGDPAGRRPMTTRVTVHVETGIVIAYHATWDGDAGQEITYWANLTQAPPGVKVLAQGQIDKGHPS